jgi:hypothetical protein
MSVMKRDVLRYLLTVWPALCLLIIFGLPSVVPPAASDNTTQGPTTVGPFPSGEGPVFSWTPTEDQAGEWIIRFKVIDPGGLSDYEDVHISVYSKTDVNRDWSVDVLDVIDVGQQLGGVEPGDINGDGVVNVLDVIAVAQAEWGNYYVLHDLTGS